MYGKFRRDFWLQKMKKKIKEQPMMYKMNEKYQD